jgi:hypothetical protein
VNFKGRSAVSLQLSTEEVYRDFPARGVAADVHGVMLRAASLEDILTGKMLVWSGPQRRQSKRLKDLSDIARLVEMHTELCQRLSDDLKSQIRLPAGAGEG